MGIIRDIRATIVKNGTSILDPWIGSEQTKKEILAVLISGRNVLLEGHPGVGKTLLAKSIAQSLPDIQAKDCSFNCEPGSVPCPQCHAENKQVITIQGKNRFVRVQGSPEITAEDLIGDIDPVLAMQYGAFDSRAFFPGKIVKANRKILFVDEINRLSEKIQNTLLQVLQERELTVGNFDVNFAIDTVMISTMNSRDTSGIELLSEALKDRLERVVVPYPTESEEVDILEMYGKKMVDVPQDIKKKIIQVCQKTRIDEELEFPASPRSAIAIHDLSQGFARLRQSMEVNLEDLSRAVRLALLGRLTPSTESDFFNKTEEYIDRLKRELYAE
jgi:Mg-chelatase subunit ChlI